MLKPKAPKLFDENPEWSAADFKKAVQVDGVSLAEAVEAVLEKARAGRKR